MSSGLNATKMSCKKRTLEFTFGLDKMESVSNCDKNGSIDVRGDERLAGVYY